MLHRQYIGSNYRWGIWKVTETFAELLALLPDRGAMYMRELADFKSEARKMERLATRVLLYTLIQDLKRIGYHSTGKPYIVGGDAYISISHTTGYVAVIVSQTDEVGIDIEKTGDRINRVAHKFIREDEYLPTDPAERTRALLLVWSAKEVMFKCLDQEAVDFRKHLYANLAPRSVVDAVGSINPFSFIGKETRTTDKREFLIHYVSEPDFVMTYSVASETPDLLK